MISAIAALLLLGAAPDATVATSEAPAPKAQKQKKICKVDPAHTGSRMAKKLCLTETEWAQREAGKDAADLKTMGAR